MEINNKIKTYEVSAIAKDFCDLLDSGYNHEVIYANVDLLDDKELKTYTTMLCCRTDDVDDVLESIKQFNGKSKEDYKLDNNICHIATFLNLDNNYFYNISFDDMEECEIHANINDKYRGLEYFFKDFIDFRNNLILKNDIVKEDDIYQFFLSVVRGFPKKKNNNINDKIRQKIKK